MSPPSLILSHSRALRFITTHVRRRHLLLPVILLAHALLLLLLISSRIPTPQGQGRIGSPVAVFNVATAQEQSPPVEPPPPIVSEVVLPEPVVPMESEVPPIVAKPFFDAAAVARAGFGTSCDLAGAIGRAFEDNQIIQRELARIERDSRSVANAIMFWDGDWVDMPGRVPADALQSLRRAIVEGVSAAPPECLVEEVAGPRFISVRETGSTMVLVIGSGRWRWQQIFEESVEGAGTIAPSVQ